MEDAFIEEEKVKSEEEKVKSEGFDFFLTFSSNSNFSLMEEVWITEQVVNSFGGFKKFLEFLPTEIRKTVLEGKRINDLPSDLLAKVLSYVDLKDIRNLFSVCKHWNNIVNTKPHFWNPFIKMKLKNLPDFNTFSFSEIETSIRCKMEWIFRKNFLHFDGKKLHRHNACCNLNLVNDGNTSILYYSPHDVG